jgi:hypothetical protein
MHRTASLAYREYVQQRLKQDESLRHKLEHALPSLRTPCIQ